MVDLNSSVVSTIEIDDSFWPIGGARLFGLTYSQIIYNNALNSRRPWEGWLSSSSRGVKLKKTFLWFNVKKLLDKKFGNDEDIPVEKRVIYSSDYNNSKVRYRMRVVDAFVNILSSQYVVKPDAWRQYAKVLDAAGNEIEARRVRTELARRMTSLNIDRMKVHKTNRIRIWLYQAWRYVFGKVSDYGLMPVKSLYCGLALLAFGWVIFYLNFPDMVLARERVYMIDAYSNYKQGDPLPIGYPNFNPFIYALDVMLPIVDFAQESHWRPKNVEGGINWLRWYNRAHLAFGWFLSTIFVLGFTGLIRDKKESQ